MLKIKQSTLILFLSNIILTSCGDQYLTMGTDLINNDDFFAETIDTSTVKLYTYNLDSVVSNNLGRLLVGKSENEWLGVTNSKGLFNVSLDSTYSYTFASEHYNDLLTFDSCVIALVPDSYYYGDSLSKLNIQIYQLEKQIKASDDGYLYTLTDQFNAGDSYKEDFLLGETSLYPKPMGKEEIFIKMPNYWGLNLFNKFISDADQVSTDDDLAELLKGFSAEIKSNSITDFFIGFSENTALRIYYTDKSKVPYVHNYISLSIGSGSIYYNQIKINRNNAIASSENSTKIGTPSSETSQKAFLQNGSGTTLRVEMPYLWNYLETGEDLTVAEATLMLKLDDNTVSEKTLPSSEVDIYLVDSRNNLISIISQVVEISYNLELDRDNYAKIDVRQFINAILEREYDPQKYALLIRASNSITGVSVNHWIIDATQHKNATKLEIKFLKKLNQKK